MVLPESDINQALDVLIRNEQLDPRNREKVAAALRSDPVYALKLAARVSTFSAPAHEEGGGLPKEASEDVSEPDDDLVRKEQDSWAKVRTEGA